LQPKNNQKSTTANPQALQLVERKLILAKNEAISLVSTPEFGELQQIGNFLRRQYRKYNPNLR
jgi:hypothetical protein